MAASPVAPSGLHVWENSQLPVNRLPQEILIHIVIYVTAADPSGYEMLSLWPVPRFGPTSGLAEGI